jgi:hypothetical protein
VLQSWNKTTSLFTEEEGIIVIKSINLFEEALDFRVSSEYGGGQSTAEEEPLFSLVA